MNASHIISRIWTDGALREYAAQTRNAISRVHEARARAMLSLLRASDPFSNDWRAAASEPLDAALGRLGGAVALPGANGRAALQHAEAYQTAASSAAAQERIAAATGARLALQTAVRLVRLGFEMGHHGKHADVLPALCALAESLPEASIDPRTDDAVRAISVIAAGLPTEGGSR